MRRLRSLTTVALLTCALLGGALPVLAASAGVVNINTASADTLALLPHVGPAVAARIVEYREANGRFEKKDDLLLVRGIGERTYAQIEPYVVLDGDSTLKEKVRVPRATEEDGGSEHSGR